MTEYLYRKTIGGGDQLLAVDLTANEGDFLGVSGGTLGLFTPSGTGEVNTASNVGTGEDVFKQKTGVDLEFRGIEAGSAKITTAVNGDNIDIDIGTLNINDLADVDTTGLADDNILRYDIGTGTWKVEPLSATVNLAHGGFYWEGNATITDFSATGVADYAGTNMLKASGTSTADDLNDFSHTNGRITYDGVTTKTFLVSVDSSITNSKGERTVFLAIYKNGTEERTLQAFTNKDEPYSVSVQALVSLATNDYLEVRVGKSTASMDDITVWDLEVTASET